MSTALIVEGYHYTAHDARATITNLGAWWAQLLSGRGPVPQVDGLLAEQVALLALALHRPSPSPAATAGAIEAVGELGREAYVAIGDGRVDRRSSSDHRSGCSTGQSKRCGRRAVYPASDGLGGPAQRQQRGRAQAAGGVGGHR